jgi:hypothetical protein
MALGRCIFGVAACLALAPASAGAATLTVGSGNTDFSTISAASAAAQAGDTVLVSPGRYRETISVSAASSSVTFRGVGDSRPVVDGDGVRAFGFKNEGANDLTIENFEMTGQTSAGIYSRGARALLSGNLIHHVGSAAQASSHGIHISRGRANRVLGNVIHHIGPGLSSFGVWLAETRDAEVMNNTIYLVRKEGIRDWMGLDNAVSGNRVFLNWSGIGLNTSTGSAVTNNLIYDNVEGLAVKHASYARVLDYWQLDSPRWSRLTHNTVFRSTETSIWMGQSDEPLDYVEVTSNRFSGAGTAFVRDSPSLRGPQVVFDNNAYSVTGGRPRWLYKAGWSAAAGLTDWPAVRQATGWEQNAAAADAGASGVAPATLTWTPYPMTPIDSSSKGTYYTRAHLDKTSDNDQNSYWLTAGNENEFVVFDFGADRTFDHLILTLYSHDDIRNPRGYRFEASADGRTWTTIHSGVNGDTSGAARYYELPRPTTARFLKFTMLDTFCDSYSPRLSCGEYFVLSDVKAGLLSARSADDTILGIPIPDVTDLLPDTDERDSSPDAPAIASPARLSVARVARLTRSGKLRLRLRCVGEMHGRGRLTISGTRRDQTRAMRLGRARPELRTGCERHMTVTLRKSVVNAVRRGKIRRLRVTASVPGESPVTSRIALLHRS